MNSYYFLFTIGFAGNIILPVAYMLAAYSAFKPDSLFLRHLRQSSYKPLLTAVCIHWSIYFGVINLGPIILKSEHQHAYEWVVSHPYLHLSSVYSFAIYSALIFFLLVVSFLQPTLKCFVLPLSSSRSSYDLPLVFAILILILSICVSPVIATDVGNYGAWLNNIPFLLHPLGKGLFLLEMVPVLYAGISLLQSNDPRLYPKLAATSLLQLTSFILLRQRFVTLIAIVFLAVCFSKHLRKRHISFFFSFGLLIAYILPTALRYRRLPRLDGQSLSSYLQQSLDSFVAGLAPSNLINSAINDFSYNKAGFASLSIVLDLKSKMSLSTYKYPFCWLTADFYRALPGFMKTSFPQDIFKGAEAAVTVALGVGSDGWIHPGVAPAFSTGWVVDMMETPLLDPFTCGGPWALIIFPLVTAVLLSIIWNIVTLASSRLMCLWFLPLATLAIVALGTSWVGDILVLFKIALPWSIVSLLVIHLPNSKRNSF